MTDTFSVIVKFDVQAEKEDQAFKMVADGVGESRILAQFPFSGFYVAPKDNLELQLALKTLGQLKVEKDIENAKLQNSDETGDKNE